MKIRMFAMAMIVLIVIFGGIAGMIAVDIWTTTSDKIPVKYKEGKYAGDYNPEDIRGSYTFEEVANLFEIDLQVLYQAFGIAENTEGTQIKIKDLKILFEDAEIEIGNESVQVFIALYKNLPMALDDEIYLPKQAVDILIEGNHELTQEQKDFLEDHQVNLGDVNLALEVTNESESNNDKILQADTEEQLVKGATTFQQVLDMGIKKAQIEAIIGKELPPTNQTVKDYCIKEGLSFSIIKEQINQLVE